VSVRPRRRVARVALAALAALALAHAPQAALAGSLTFVVRAPAATPADGGLWISGDRAELGSWSGAGLALARTPSGLWIGTVRLPAAATVEFKVTRGDWNRVEKDARGGEIANRRWTVAGDDTVRVEVAAWRDLSGPPAPVRAHTLTGDVRVHAAFPSSYVPARDVLVWLPPGYEADTTRRYPVVYFHDGQNVFDGATSFIPGSEWGADEAADAAVRAGRLPPCILVAVGNSPRRIDEYTAVADARHGGGHLDAYGRFLTGELVPFVDRTYRTLRDPAHTALVGSSLGALASLDLALQHPGRFGLVGCVSPAAWWADTAIVRSVRAARGHPRRVWLDIGTAEETAGADGSRPWVDQARALRDALEACGMRAGGDLHYEEIEGGRHNEAAWAARVGRIMEFLLAER